MDDVSAYLLLAGILIGIPLGWWLRVEGRRFLAMWLDRIEDAARR